MTDPAARTNVSYFGAHDINLGERSFNNRSAIRFGQSEIHVVDGNSRFSLFYRAVSVTAAPGTEGHLPLSQGQVLCAPISTEGTPFLWTRQA
ncbi:MAG: hypothetical protein AAFQ58_17205 [Pseudomonadota bacterium]